ncbi:MAG TPA: lytic transglycosylase domain-containing protein [Thermoanaerobaculia bacterium]|nr:lytic transglycosylase domain-containing protein [Thermoanaerobaculia bacterium]
MRNPRRLLPTAALAGTLALLLPAVAAAELVILEDGRHLKARAYQVQGERVRVELWRGGQLTLPLARVERVVDDEVIPPEPGEPAVAAAEPAAPAGFAWRFAEDQPVPDSPVGHLIYAAARRHEVNPALVAALVRAESAYDVGAVSHKGARGLMQLMPATARRFGVAAHEIFDPEKNLDAGTRYLRWLLERFDGDIALALAAYNAGEGTVDRYRGIPPYRETRTYVRRIFTTLGMADRLATLL